MEDLSMFHLVYKILVMVLNLMNEHFNVLLKIIKKLFLKFLKELLNLLKKKDLQNLTIYAIDGTIIKANNSNYNIIKAKEIDKLIKIIRKQYDTETILEKGYKLSKSAYRFLTNHKLTDNEKIKKLEELKKKN